MKTRLIIAEKPDMGRKIAAALSKPQKTGQGYIETPDGVVSWCIGHIMRSFSPEEYNKDWAKWSFDALPMLLDDWKIAVETEKSKQFKVIKELLGNCTEVVNAGDPGREGQLIVDEVLYFLKNKKPVKRILLYALDQKSITQAFANLQDNALFFNLYEAGVCRGYADWSMGMNGTRAYTLLAQKTGYKGVLSVGRVQSPTLAIVVRRDLEIDNFVPHDYYNIIGTFNHMNTKFDAYWKPEDTIDPTFIDEDKRLINQNHAVNIVAKVKNKEANIVDYSENQGREGPPLPFSLSKLQIYANAKWGMSAKSVLDTCQSLYEKHELQSYPRSDCQYLPENLFGDAQEILTHIGNSTPSLTNAVNGANTTLKSSAWNDSKLGEHYGIIPTKKQADLSVLSDYELKIYQAVCERFICQFYPDCEFKTAIVLIECEKEKFKANGKVINKAGWRAIFNNEEENDDDKKTDEEDQIFPALRTGDSLDCVDSKLLAKKTTPPGRYTEGTLIKAMTNVHTLVSDPEQKKKLKEKKGIGQEATRTQILENLFKRTLLTRVKSQIISSPAGRELVKVLPKKVTDPALTAIWEDALDKIAEGKMTSALFKQKQNEWVVKLIEEAKNTTMSAITQAAPVKKATSSTASASKGSTAKSKPAKSKGTCPKCNTGTLVERTAKASGNKFLSCNNWPKCNHSEWPKK